MMNFTEFIPQSACSFYAGYYAMSGDMGMMILKLGVLFLVLELVHFFLKNLFEYYFMPKIKRSLKTETFK